MNSRITFGELKELALHQADMESSSFPTPARLTHLTNIALSKTRDLLINAFEDFWREKQTITLVSGQEEYDLPEGYYKTIKLFYVNGDRRYPLDRFTLDGISGYKRSPDTSGELEHWYIQEFVPLKSDESLIDWPVPQGWEDYASLLVAMRLRVKEETDDPQLKNELMEAKQHIIDMAETRDIGTQLAISDVYHRWGVGDQTFPEDGENLRYRVMGKKLIIVNFDYLGA